MSINSKRQQLLALFTKSERKQITRERGKQRRKRETICCDHVNKGFKFNFLDKVSNKVRHTNEPLPITEIRSSVSNFQKKKKER